VRDAGAALDGRGRLRRIVDATDDVVTAEHLEQRVEVDPLGPDGGVDVIGLAHRAAQDHGDPADEHVRRAELRQRGCERVDGGAEVWLSGVGHRSVAMQRAVVPSVCRRTDPLAGCAGRPAAATRSADSQGR